MLHKWYCCFCLYWGAQILNTGTVIIFCNQLGFQILKEIYCIDSILYYLNMLDGLHACHLVLSANHSYRFPVLENTTANLVSYLWSLKIMSVVCCHWYLTHKAPPGPDAMSPNAIWNPSINFIFLCKQRVQIQYYRKIPVIGKALKVHKVKWEYYRNLIPEEVCDQEYWRANGEIISGVSSMKNCHVDNMNHRTGHVSSFFTLRLDCSEPSSWSVLTKYTYLSGKSFCLPASCVASSSVFWPHFPSTLISSLKKDLIRSPKCS